MCKPIKQGERREQSMNGRPNLSPRTRKTALLGMLAAAALALSFLENLIPGLPGLPPGAKPGFSNIATMAAAAQLGFAGAFPITLLKAGFAGLTRGATAFFMSTAGGVLSMLVMLPLLHGKRNPFGAVGTGILCAVMHNLGQLMASWALTGTKAIFGYAPLLLLFALLTGLATGAVYGAIAPSLNRIFPSHFK